MAKIQKVSDDFKGISTTNFRIFTIFWGDFSGFSGFFKEDFDGILGFYCDFWEFLTIFNDSLGF